MTGAYHNAPAFGDLDGDGDLDAVLGTWRPAVDVLWNRGTRAEPVLEPGEAPLLTLTRGANAVPTLGDLDADGDLDLMIGEASGTLNYYRNDGTPSDPSFTLVSDEYLEIDVGRRASPRLVDIDGDGDLDLVVGSEDAGIALYRNDGDAGRPDFRAADGMFPGELHKISAPTLGDLDGDGVLELLVGGAGGGLQYYQNVGASGAS